ncbi:MAG: AI-2E family transporter [Leptospiraceae bacterium]|nr:AI-2E family transporter [Leptospiraceae bacterium]
MLRDTDISTHVVRLLFFGLVIGFLAVTLYGLQALVIPIGLSFLLTFALNPGVNFLEGLGIPRILSVVLVLLVFIGGVVGLFSFIIPPALEESANLFSKLANLGQTLTDLVAQWKGKFLNWIPAGVQAPELDIQSILNLVFSPLSQGAKNLLGNMSNFITYLLVSPILIFLFLLQGDEMFRSVIGLVPNRYFELALLIVHRTREQIAAYLRGMAIQIAILMVILIPGFSLAGLSYGAILGGLAAMVNIIPYMGPIIGLAPAIIVALTVDGGNVPVFVLIAFGIAQAVDNMFTQPVVLARSVSVHPVIAILALITFQQWLGVIGMIVAIPLAGILVMMISTLYKSLKAFKVI